MKVKGTNNQYLFTDINMTEGVITKIVNDCIKIKILKHVNKTNIGIETECWAVKDDYFEIIKEKSKTEKFEFKTAKFMKKDLKKGDMVTLRDGSIGVYDGTSAGKLSSWSMNDDLTNKGSMGDAFDVVKVERPKEYETVFERDEKETEILDEVEKRYLAGIIRPFKSKVKVIVKKSSHETVGEFIFIDLGDDAAVLPDFKNGTMYKGMKIGKKYTLKELGL